MFVTAMITHWREKDGKRARVGGNGKSTGHVCWRVISLDIPLNHGYCPHLQYREIFQLQESSCSLKIEIAA